MAGVMVELMVDVLGIELADATVVLKVAGTAVMMD